MGRGAEPAPREGGIPATGRIVRALGAVSNGPSGESPSGDLADRTGVAEGPPDRAMANVRRSA